MKAPLAKTNLLELSDDFKEATSEAPGDPVVKWLKPLQEAWMLPPDDLKYPSVPALQGKGEGPRGRWRAFILPTRINRCADPSRRFLSVEGNCRFSDTPKGIGEKIAHHRSVDYAQPHCTLRQVQRSPGFEVVEFSTQRDRTTVLNYIIIM